jgi:hypothetical protein
MKRVKKTLNRWVLISLFGSILFGVACTKDFKTVNIDQNTIGTIGPAELPFLFSKALDVAPGAYYNYQVAQNLFADQYAQYFACEATYFPSDRLVIRQDWLGASFNPMYTDVLPQLQAIFTSTDSTTAEWAMADVWWVYTFHRVTDYFGPIPYFSAGIAAVTVPYDSQDKIYDDFFKRLTDAAAILKNHAGENHYGTFDLIYGGDVNRWIKFANSLRLRLAIRISKVDPARAKAEGEAAVAGGVMENSAAIADPASQTAGDDALVSRSANNTDGNGLQSMSDWNEFRMSATMASVLNGYDDPRLPQYFLPTYNSGTDYKGLRNGLSIAQLGLVPNLAANNSHVGQRWSSTAVVDKSNNILGSGTSIATSQNIMCTAEVYFLRAEGALLGWNMGGTAEDMYNKGISNSLIQWNVGSTGNINTYTNSTKTPIAPGDYLNSPAVSNVPVKWSADPNMELQQIATQKWLALYPDGMEAWADYRRSHVMKLYPVVNSDNLDIPDPNTQWLRRVNFLLSERQNNGPAVDAAVGLLGGPDKVTTPLWWDKN